MAKVIPQRVLDRVFTGVDVAGPDDCWRWTRALDRKGYGRIGWQDGGRAPTALAHRVVWIATNGAIPDGLEVDHICSVRSCCNPRHLRLLTRSENAGRNSHRIKTHCVAGHPYDERNTYYRPTGGRQCRICKNAAAARSHAAVRGVAA